MMRRLALGLTIAVVISFSAAQPNGIPEPLRPYIGKPIPDVTLIDADGRKYKLSSLAGKVLLLNFWSPY